MCSSDLCGPFFELYLTVLRVQRALCRQLGDAAEGQGQQLTSSHISALLLLSREGPVPMSQLARGILVSPQQLSGIVALLIKRGLVERSAHPTNRRVVLAELTPRGQAMVEQLQNLLVRYLPTGSGEARQMARAISTVSATLTNFHGQ